MLINFGEPTGSGLSMRYGKRLKNKDVSLVKWNAYMNIERNFSWNEVLRFTKLKFGLHYTTFLLPISWDWKYILYKKILPYNDKLFKLLIFLKVSFKGRNREKAPESTKRRYAVFPQKNSWSLCFSNSLDTCKNDIHSLENYLFQRGWENDEMSWKKRVYM